MTAQVQHRRGSASQIAAATPAAGEIVVDTTNNRVVVGDGTTAGGHPMARLDEVTAASRTAVTDASVTATASSRLIAYTSLTAARSVTLPAASDFPTGVTLTVVDESGSCNSTKTISILRAGSDTISGETVAILASPHAFISLESDGVSKWSFVSRPYVNHSYDLSRNWAMLSVPYFGDNRYIDNVLAIQNRSRGTLDGTGTVYAANCAINFLDTAGTERCAIGYSHNNGLWPNGYSPNTCYIEIGNPFTSDADGTNFSCIVTLKAGGPYWGGAAVGYHALDIVSATGDIITRFPGSGSFGVEMTSTTFRMRERHTSNAFAMTTNVANMSEATTLAQDNPALSSWEIAMGGGVDGFSILRAPAGATLQTQNVQLLGLSVVNCDLGVPLKLKSYTVAGLPSASLSGAGALVYVPNASGGPTIACSDGTNWKVVAALGATVS